MKNILLLIILLHIGTNVFCQDTIKQPITKFFYKDGSLSSEGTLIDGKPDGYWKTYYKNGKLKSEGNRVNYQLNNNWKFYNQEGDITKQIIYKNGIRNGNETHYNKGVLAELIPYVNNIKEGILYKYFKSGNVHYQKKYVNNQASGKAYEFDDKHNIITIETYKQGVLNKIQRVNRTDIKEFKQGLWVWFNKNKVIIKQGTFTHGVKHGYFKYYDRKGKLLKTEKYVNGELHEDAVETAKLDIRRSYYSNNNMLKSYNSYRKDKKDGVQKLFNNEGKVTSTEIYYLGVLSFKGGVIDDKGKKQGEWTEFYRKGAKKSEGSFEDNNKSGLWKYYYESGNIEQEGIYKKGKATNKWVWYHNSGKILRVGYYISGKENGEFTEYDANGKIVSKGEYINGKLSGDWLYVNEDYKIFGRYIDGKKDGLWTEINMVNKNIVSKVNYYEGYLNNTSTYYYLNGIKKAEGNYTSGKKHNNWNYYNEQGVKTVKVYYNNGKAIKYNNKQLSEL